MSNYVNSLRSIRDVLLDNENYTSCPLYTLLQADIHKYLGRTIARMQQRDSEQATNSEQTANSELAANSEQTSDSEDENSNNK